MADSSNSSCSSDSDLQVSQSSTDSSNTDSENKLVFKKKLNKDNSVLQRYEVFRTNRIFLI